jgi:hypothetical protein
MLTLLGFQWLHLKHSSANNLKHSLGHHALSSKALRTEAEMSTFNDKINVAPIHFAPGTNFWEVGRLRRLLPVVLVAPLWRIL